MNEGDPGPDAGQDAATREAAGRFGVLASLFQPAPGLDGGFWALAGSAYLDSPLPAVLKERLFVHLSRFSPVRSCIIRHVGLLIGEGRAEPLQTAEEALALVSRPLPDAAGLDRSLARLTASPAGGGLPAPGTPAEADLFDALAAVFLSPGRSSAAREAVRHAAGEPAFDRLMALLAFVRTAHFWAETHPAPAAEIPARLRQHPELLRRLLDPAETGAHGLHQRLASTEAALHDSAERQAFLLCLGDRMRAEDGPAAMIAAASAMLGERLGASGIVYAEIDDAAGLARIRQGWSAQGAAVHPAELRLADFGGPFLDGLRAGRVVRHDDMGGLHAVGAQAGLGVPLVVNGRFVANLNVHQDRPRVWTDAEVALCEAAAERIWAAVERARAEEALKVSEQKYRRLFDSIDQGFCVIEVIFDAAGRPADYRFLEANPAFEAQTGLASAVGRRMRDLAPDHEQFWFDTYGRIALTGQPERFEHRAEALGRWYDVYAFRIDAPGDRRVAILFADILERKRAETALRESEERFRRFGEASQDVLWIRDAGTLQWQYLTPAFETIYGLPRQEALAGDNFRSWLDLILPEDRPRAERAIRRVRGGEHVTFDYRIRRPRDGAIRWLRNTDFPITGAGGEVTLIGGIGHDLTGFHETELRLQTLMEGIPQLVWRATAGGRWTWCSPQWTAFTGLERGQSAGLGWLGALHPDDREAAMRFWDQAVHSGRLEMEGRLHHAASGDYRWFQTRATPVRDKGGIIIEWLGTSTDIHDLRLLQERQKVLVGELQHRTRNLMAVVNSIADRTARSSRDLADFGERFRNRLAALARVQGLLSRLGDHDRVTFDELIRAELSAMNHDAAGVTAEGPSGVRLRSSTVQILALALHELATNAMKYGALAQRGGRLDIRWSCAPAAGDGRPWLHIDWRESGVVMPQGAARRPGHGRNLIEQALPYQLGARTRYDLGPEGVRCAISIPVSETAGARS